MSRTVKVHDSVFEQAEDLSEEHGITIKEAIRQMCREGNRHNV